MRKKKGISIFIIFCLCSALWLPVAAEEPVTVTVNGQSLSLKAPLLMQSGRTLVPVRAVFEALGCDVYWESEEQPVLIIKNETKLLLWVENPVFYKFTGDDMTLFKEQIRQGGGEDLTAYPFDVPPQIVEGKTYVPIRALCEAMGIDVLWEDSSQTVELVCADGFVSDVNRDKVFAAQFYTLFPNGIEDGQTESELPVYVEGDLSILVKLGFLAEEDLKKDGYITNLETLEFIHKIVAGENTRDLSEWYMGNTLEPLDYLDDSIKSLLLDLLHAGKNLILTYDDILSIDLEEETTNYQALVYITRMIGNTYGCTDYPEEYYYTEPSQTYQAAYEKGIIDEMQMENANLPILRQDFYALIHKAIFTEMTTGGYAVSKGRTIDDIISRNERTAQPEEAPVESVNSVALAAVADDHMAISWTLPDAYAHLYEEKYGTFFTVYTEDGKSVGGMGMGGMHTEISTTTMIQYLAGAYPAKLDFIRCEYYRYQGNEREEWTFDIDLPDITMQVEGTALSPGVFTHNENEWVPQKISLADGQRFRKDAYYLLTSYAHTYRKPEYNDVSRAVFTVEEDTDVFLNTKNVYLGVGRIYLEDIHIQEVMIHRTDKNQFIVRVTPESTETFTVNT